MIGMKMMMIQKGKKREVSLVCLLRLYLINSVDRRIEILGTDTIGHLWPTEEEEPSSDSESEGDDPYEHPRNKTLLQLGRSLSNISSSTRSLSTLSKASSPESIASSTSLPDIPTLTLDQGPPQAFYNEARSSLERAYEEGHSCENALLELRTLVMGYNAGLDRARVQVANFLMSKIVTTGAASEVLKSSTSVFRRWGPLAIGLSPDPVNLALDIQAYCARKENQGIAGVFGILLRGLYEGDVLVEEDLVGWREKGEDYQGEGAGEEKEVWEDLWRKGKVYVDVLEDMESESEEDEEDEDEEGEDDDDE
jgi:translation initiation factor eIF-2B subunit epsilon